MKNRKRKGKRVLLLFACGTVVSGDSTVSPSLQESPIKITKSLTDHKLLGNESTIVVLKISKESTSTVNDIRISDIVPPMFKTEPNKLFRSNLFQKQIPSFGNADSFTYSISPVKVDIIKRLDILVAYRVGNSSQKLTAISSGLSDCRTFELITTPLKYQAYTSYIYVIYMSVLVDAKGRGHDPHNAISKKIYFRPSAQTLPFY